VNLEERAFKCNYFADPANLLPELADQTDIGSLMLIRLCKVSLEGSTIVVRKLGIKILKSLGLAEFVKKYRVNIKEESLGNAGENIKYKSIHNPRTYKRSSNKDKTAMT